jgi:DnaJ-class molecular chaperone
MKDYYKILGVDSTADASAIKSAYRKLAKENHPDLKPNDKEAEARFKEIGEAYETLKDESKRSQYDNMRSGRGPGPGGFSWNTNQGGFHADVDIEDILRDIKRQRGGFYYQEPPKNRDIVLGYTITLEEAFTGKEADISYNLAGKDSKKIAFKIPAGIQDGMRLRFLGKGDDTRTDVGPGDLYVRINIAPHQHFVRMGYHLATSIVVDYMDAMLGTEVEVPTIEGNRIKLRVPAGIHPGQSLKAAGKGMPVNQTQRGDMLVEVVIQPSMLNDEQRELIEQARQKRST